MKKLYKLFIIITCFLLLTGCSQTVTYDIELENLNPDYQWTFEVKDTQVIKVVDYKDRNNKNRYEVRALESGRTTIYFNYERIDDPEDILYFYSITLDVDKNSKIESVSELGNYVSLLRVININKKDLGLINESREYNWIFSDDEVNVGDDICDWLVAYDSDYEIVESYAISRNSDNIYRNIDGKRVLIN